MAKIKYSAIVGSLGQNVDRFLAEGYKEDAEMRFGFENEVDALAGLGCLDALDIYYAEEGINSDADATNEVMDKYGLVISSTFLNVFGRRKWKNGSLSSTDEAVRQEAIALAKKNSDFNAKLKGAPPMNLWLGQDGFDYPFQCDYNRALDQEVAALKQVAEMFPEHKISFEYKPYQPRAYSFIGDIATTLLVLDEVGAPNMGVTLDFCHMLMKKESPAYSLAWAARKNRLMGFHLNDGYKDNDDGLMLGSVHLMQTLEFIYYAKKYNYDGVNYFDTFPMREDPSAEVEANIETYLALDSYIDSYGLKEIEKLIEAGDAVKVQHFMLDLLRDKRLWRENIA